jgi:hypothetical protein
MNLLLWKLIVRQCGLSTLNVLRCVCKQSKNAINETVYKITNRTIANNSPDLKLQIMSGKSLWQWFNEEFDERPAKVYNGNFVGHLTMVPDMDPFSTYGVMLSNINFALWRIEVI